MPRRRLPINAHLPVGLQPHRKRWRTRHEGRWISFDGPLENAITAYKAWLTGRDSSLIGPALDLWATTYVPALVKQGRLKQRTADDYRRDIEPLKRGAGKIPIAKFTAAHGAKLRDALIETERGHARNVMAALSAFFRWAVETGRANANPMREVRKLPISRCEVLVTDADYAALYAVARPCVRIAMTLGLRTAARPDDILSLGPKHVKDGAIEFRQGKTGNMVRIALVGDLARVVAEHMAHVVYPTFVHTLTGEKFTVSGFGANMRDDKSASGVKGKFGLAQLRPKAATDVYQATGGDIRAVMALTGHRTEAQALAYIRKFVPVTARPNEKVVLVATG